MFRASLRSSFLLLMTLFAAAPAAEAADVTEVTFDVTVATTTQGSDSYLIEIRVTGTDLNNGTLTRPILGTDAVSFKREGDDLVIEDDFDSLTALDAAYPGDAADPYELRVNNGNIGANLLYVRQLVTNPDISKPSRGQTVPPAPIEVEFTNCAICSLSGDSVVAELELADGTPVDDETLAATDESWIPEDGMGGDLSLPQLTDFLARVTNTTQRQNNVVVTGEENDADDLLIFTNFFSQSDEVDFSTGFDTPAGHVCLSANDPMPPAGCTIVTDTLLQVLDTTGSYATTVNGHDVTYDVNVGSNGTLSGSAAADLNDDDIDDTFALEIKGKLKGKHGEVSEKISFKLDNPNIPAKLSAKITELFSIPGNTLDTTQKNSGTDGATKVNEELIFPQTPIPPAAGPLGWVLEFDIDASGEVQNASLVLEGGRSFALTGSNKFKFTSGESSVKLRTEDNGIKIDLKKVMFEDDVDPVAVNGGDLSQRILGQSRKAVIPTLP